MFAESPLRTVHDEQGRPYHLTRLVGQGAQGAVYAERGGDLMVKLATVRDASHQRELVRRYRWLMSAKLDAEAPLVLPQALLAPPDVGYIMRRVPGCRHLADLLYPPSACSLPDWYNATTGGLRRRLGIGALIARSFAFLQRNGLSYCDLSDTNILVPKDASKLAVCLIDCDNLAVSGQANALVLGTRNWMAPEVLARTHQPDSLSDNYSLAVLLFYLLRLGHPFFGDDVLDGPPEDEDPALRGELPYVDHPTDGSNACSRILPAHIVFNNELSKLFLGCFTEGVQHRGRRPRAADWARACWVAADETAQCSECSASCYLERGTGRTLELRCPWCGSQNREQLALEFRDLVYTEGAPLEKSRIVQFRELAIKSGIECYSQPYGSLVISGGGVLICARHVDASLVGHVGDRPIARVRRGLDGCSVELLPGLSDVYALFLNRSTPHHLRVGAPIPLTDSVLLFFLSSDAGSAGAVRCARLVGNEGKDEAQ